jgi:uncharacterized OB-fold protein
MTLTFIDSTMPCPLAPRPSDFSRPFWESLAAGRLATTRCTACARLSFPPRAFCPACGSEKHAWAELSGRGRLYSRTRIHAAGGPFAWLVPYSIGIVDLDEGVRLMTRLLSSASDLALDSPVQLAVLRHTDGVLFVATGTAP